MRQNSATPLHRHLGSAALATQLLAGVWIATALPGEAFGQQSQDRKASLVRDLLPGPFSSQMDRCDINDEAPPVLVATTRHVLLTGRFPDCVGDLYLWSTKGHDRGTVKLLGEDLQQIRAPQAPIPVEDGLVFFTPHGVWRFFDSSGRAKKISQLGLEFFGGGAVDQEGRILFVAPEPGASWRPTLWATEGNPGDAVLLFSDDTADFIPELASAQGFAAFVASHVLGQEDRNELWVTEGTPETTRLVGVVAGMGSSAWILDSAAVGSDVYLILDDSTGQSLWLYRHLDGSLGPLMGSPTPLGLLGSVGGHLVFTGFDESHGTELWTTDGTRKGTRLLRDVNPGPAGSDPPRWYEEWRAPLAADEVLYVDLEDGRHGKEIWRTDGTTEGTELVTDLRPGPDSSVPYALAEHGPWIYFSAYHPDVGREIWRLHKGQNVVELFADVVPGEEGSEAGPFAFLPNRVVFHAKDAATGREPWTIRLGPGD